MHFREIRSSAMKRTISEGEGCGRVANNTEQKSPAEDCVVDGQLV